MSNSACSAAPEARSDATSWQARFRSRSARCLAAIVGGAGGIGRATVETLATAGVTVAVIDLDTAELRSIVDAAGDGAVGLRADVSSRESIDRAFDQLADKWGRLDVLVNTAGVAHFDPDGAMTSSEWERVVAINLTGTFNACAAARDLLRRGEDAAVVNVSSVSGRTRSVYTSPAYVASKAGIIGLTMSLASRWARDGIRVNCVAPGVTETQMARAYSPTQRAEIEAGIPLGRFAQPAEIAAAIVFLCSPQSSYITGEVLNVNGGAFMV